METGSWDRVSRVGGQCMAGQDCRPCFQPGALWVERRDALFCYTLLITFFLVQESHVLIVQKLKDAEKCVA